MSLFLLLAPSPRIPVRHRRRHLLPINVKFMDVQLDILCMQKHRSWAELTKRCRQISRISALGHFPVLNRWSACHLTYGLRQLETSYLNLLLMCQSRCIHDGSKPSTISFLSLYYWSYCSSSVRIHICHCLFSYPVIVYQFQEALFPHHRYTE